MPGIEVSVVAAFCAAEKTDEKKPPPALEFSTASGVGVVGSVVLCESLLGTTVVLDPDFVRLWKVEDRVGEPPRVGSFPPQGERLSGDDAALAWKGSTGVGGVLMMVGAGLSPEGGVRGVSVVILTDGGFEKREAVLAGTASSGDCVAAASLELVVCLAEGLRPEGDGCR